MTAEAKTIHAAKLRAAFLRFLEGWGLKADESAQGRFIAIMTQGEEVVSDRCTVPRDAPLEYRADYIRSVRHRMLVRIDEEGYFPASPIKETSVHVSMKYGPNIDVPPESDDWDHEQIRLRCYVWKLREG